MSDIEPVEEIMARIMQQYSRKPQGWHVLSTPDGDLLVLGPDTVYQLRLLPLSPYKVTGVGIELHDPPKCLASIRAGPSFGVRGLTHDDLNIMLSALQGNSSAISKVDDILKRNPLPLSAIETARIDHLLSGPVLSRPSLASLDATLGEYTERLDISARDLFRKRYPLRSGMFY